MSKRTTTRPKQVSPLRKPFYVYDNVHDWINGVSLGCGLADLMCHYEMRSVMGNLRKVPDPKVFIKYANKHLNNPTSAAEIKDLLCYHDSAHKSSAMFERNLFDSDGKDVSPYDSHLKRIIAIRNAYVTEVNYQLAVEQGVMTFQSVSAYNQGESIDKQAADYREAFEQGMLDDKALPPSVFEQELRRGLISGTPPTKRVPDMTPDEWNAMMAERGGLKVLTPAAAVTSAVPQTAKLPGADGPFNVADILDVDVMLMNDSFDGYASSTLTPGLTSTILALMSQANDLLNQGWVSTDLLDRYFNAGDPSYPQGMNSNLYLDGKLQAETLNGELPALQKLAAETKAGREPSYQDGRVRGYVAIQLAYMYKIPLANLASEYQELMDPTTVTGSIVDGHLQVVSSYLRGLLDVHLAYWRLINEKERKTATRMRTAAVTSRLRTMPLASRLRTAAASRMRTVPAPMAETVMSPAGSEVEAEAVSMGGEVSSPVRSSMGRTMTTRRGTMQAQQEMPSEEMSSPQEMLNEGMGTPQEMPQEVASPVRTTVSRMRTRQPTMQEASQVQSMPQEMSPVRMRMASPVQGSPVRETLTQVSPTRETLSPMREVSPAEVSPTRGSSVRDFIPPVLGGTPSPNRGEGTYFQPISTTNEDSIGRLLTSPVRSATRALPSAIGQPLESVVTPPVNFAGQVVDTVTSPVRGPLNTFVVSPIRSVSGAVGSVVGGVVNAVTSPFRSPSRSPIRTATRARSPEPVPENIYVGEDGVDGFPEQDGLLEEDGNMGRGSTPDGNAY
jgi:hypothetical protein